ncbi:MAG: hypothetical protein QW279_15745 [Candidatus Jordarchaeaceae archaeon]
MSKTKELEISTVIVSGTRNLFKAALSRSLLGVTYKKFSKRKTKFFANRTHNEIVTEGVFDCLYESLLTSVTNVSDLDIKTKLKPEWDENGKLLSVSDLSVSVYMKVGELKIQKLQVKDTIDSIKIDLFFSEIDARSRKLRTDLPSIIKEIGNQKIEYTEHDFLTPEGRQMAQAYKIETVPTVLINAEKPLEDPNENQLRQEIEKAFQARVEPIGNIEFIPDNLLKPNVKVVSQIKTH